MKLLTALQCDVGNFLIILQDMDYSRFRQLLSDLQAEAAALQHGRRVELDIPVLTIDQEFLVLDLLPPELRSMVTDGRPPYLEVGDDWDPHPYLYDQAVYEDLMTITVSHNGTVRIYVELEDYGSYEMKVP